MTTRTGGASPDDAIDLIVLLRPRRAIVGTAAVLLPFDAAGDLARANFESHVARTVDFGLITAVNMGAGYVDPIDDAACAAGLDRAAVVADSVGARFDRDAWRATGDPRCYERNDRHQELSGFASRDPGPASKRAAAMSRNLREWIDADRARPHSPTRPEADRAVPRTIAAGLA